MAPLAPPLYTGLSAIDRKLSIRLTEAFLWKGGMTDKQQLLGRRECASKLTASALLHCQFTWRASGRLNSQISASLQTIKPNLS